MTKNNQFKGEALPSEEAFTPEKLKGLQDNVNALEALMFLVERNKDLAKTALTEQSKKD